MKKKCSIILTSIVSLSLAIWSIDGFNRIIAAEDSDGTNTQEVIKDKIEIDPEVNGSDDTNSEMEEAQEVETPVTEVETPVEVKEPETVEDIAPFAFTDIVIKRVDGLYADTTELILYIPEGVSYVISEIEIETFGYWNSGLINVRGEGYYSVTITSKDLEEYLKNPLSVGTKKYFTAKFYNGVTYFTTPKFYVTVEDADLMRAKALAKDVIETLNLTRAEKEYYKDEVQVQTTIPVVEAVRDAAILDAHQKSLITSLRVNANNSKPVITALTNINQDEKDAFNARIEEQFTLGIAAIQATTSVELADEAYNTYSANMLAIVNEARARDYKNRETEIFNKFVNDNLTMLDNMNLSDDYKADIISQIEVKREFGLMLIEGGTTEQASINGRTFAQNQINTIMAAAQLESEKNDAIDEVKAYAETKKLEISGLTVLSQTSIDGYHSDIDIIVTKYEGLIGAETTIDNLTTLVNNAKVEIDAVVKAANDQVIEEFNNGKIKAVEDLIKKGKEAKEIINNNPNLTQDQKDELTGDVSDAVTKGTTEINEAETVEELNDAIGDANTAIDNILDKADFYAYQENAKKELRSYADAAIESLTENPNVTEEELPLLVDQINAYVTTYSELIDQATTTQGVDDALTLGKEKIDEVQASGEQQADTNLADAKVAAKLALRKHADSVIGTISTNPDLSEGEIQNLVNEINGIVNAGNTAIDEQTTIQNVENEKNEAINEINNVLNKAIDNALLNNAKLAAKQEIRNYADAKILEIENNPNLRPQDKVNFTKEINDIVVAAYGEIDEVTEITALPAIIIKSKADIDAVVTESEIEAENNVEEDKNQAIIDLDKKGEEAKEAINNNPNLTDKEKEDFVKEIDDALTKGKENIDNANTIKDVEKAKDDAETIIDGILDNATLQGEKNKAKKDLEDYAQEAIKKVNDLKNLTQPEKDKIIEDIEKIVEDESTAIDNANDTTEIGVILDGAKEDIDNLVKDGEIADADNLQNVKDQAKVDLDKKADTAKGAINTNPNLTDKEKEDFVKEIDDAVTEGKKDIDDAPTIDDVDKIKDEVEESIDNTANDAALQAEKNKAKKELRVYANEAILIIEKNNDLNDQEKEDLIGRIEDVVTDANTNIDAAADIPTVQDVLKNAKEDIDAIVDESIQRGGLYAEQVKAKKEIRDHADAKIIVISNNPNLTTNEKEALVKEVNAIVSEAHNAIDDATQINQLAPIVKQAKDDIDAVEAKANNQGDKNLEDEKKSAKDELDKKGEDAKKEVNDNPNLTDKEKEA